MKEIKVVVGNDNGNSEHDLIINGTQICQPNVVSKVRRLPMLDEINKEFVLKKIEDNLIVTIDSPSAAPGFYYIGNYALNSGSTIRNIEVGSEGNSKIDSEIPVVNTLAQIAGYAIKQNGIEEDIFVSVDMVTALPVTQYNKHNVNLFAEKFTQDKHKVTVHIGTTRVSVEIKFQYVKVLPEGVTTTFALQAFKKDDKIKFTSLNEEEEEFIDGSYFKEKRILHIGIGEGTTEYPITRGIEFDPNFIKGSDNGIGHAIDSSIDEFKQVTGLLQYSRQKFSEVLKDSGHKHFSVASEIVENYIEEETIEIIHYAKKEIQKANGEIDLICIYGGGSISMGESLIKNLKPICKKSNIKLLLIPQEYAVIIESIGMYNFATGPIFQALKNKAINSK